MKKIMIGIPSYDHKISVTTVMSLLRDVNSLKDTSVKFQIQSGCCLIARVRNSISAAFLASDCDELIFIDADVGWEAGALQRLLSYPVDVVAGVYPKRTDRYQDYPVMWPEGATKAEPSELGLFEVWGVATGFMRISRDVFQDLMVAHPKDYYIDTDSQLPGGLVWTFFHHEISDKTYWGEDYYFCKRYRALGGKIWIDPEITFDHFGDKTFTGHLGNWLRAGSPGHPLLKKEAA